MKISFFLVVLFSSIMFSQKLLSLEEFLGYPIGSDYKIANYETIQKYFQHLAQNSKMIVYEEIGKIVQKKRHFHGNY